VDQKGFEEGKEVGESDRGEAPVTTEYVMEIEVYIWKEASASTYAAAG
jgi:hypothetical protein